MKIFKNSLIVLSVIFSGLVLPALVYAQQSDTLTVWTMQDLNQSGEIHKFSSSQYTQKIEYPSSCSSGNLNMAYSIGSPFGMSIAILNSHAPVKDMEPTTTVNLLFEEVDIPFNKIPGGFTLEEIEEHSLLYGEGVVVAKDSDNNNRIIVTLPALTVEESNEVLCEIYEEFFPPRILVSGSPEEFIRVWVDFDLFKFTNIPFLQTHRVIDPRRNISDMEN